MFDKNNTPVKAIMNSILGLVFFGLSLYIANCISNSINIYAFTSLVNLFNRNLYSLVAVVLLFLIGNIIIMLSYPISLAGPLFKALASGILISFLFKLFDFLSVMLSINVGFINRLRIPVYIAVIAIILFVEYVKIFGRPIEVKENNQKKVEWNDVGQEFKSVIYNITHRLNKSTAPKQLEIKSKKKNK
jgi:hypothetical protein